MKIQKSNYSLFYKDCVVCDWCQLIIPDEQLYISVRNPLSNKYIEVHSRCYNIDMCNEYDEYIKHLHIHVTFCQWAHMIIEQRNES